MTSLEQLPPSFVGTINIPIKTFLFIGLDFFDDTKTRFKNHCKLFFFIIGLFTFLGGQIFFFFNIDETGADFLDVANAIPCLMLILQNILKLRIIRKKNMIRSIILDIAELWPNEFQSEDKKEIMMSWNRRIVLCCDAVFKVTVTSLVLYTQVLLFVYFLSSYDDGDTAYMYPFQLYYFLKIDTLWKYLMLYMTQAVVGTIIHTCMYSSCDQLLVTLTVDVCILLRMLQYDLENIKVEPGQEESLAKLKDIVKTHQKLLRLAENMNEIFGIIMFVVVLCSSVIICLFIFLTIVATAPLQLFKNFLAVTQVLSIVFYIMLPGQILSDTSSGVADAAYQSLWYDSDPKFRKIICIIIARSQEPCKLRALSYTDMNFNAFCKICSTAWSYVSLVNQMYQKD